MYSFPTSHRTLFRRRTKFWTIFPFALSLSAQPAVFAVENPFRQETAFLLAGERFVIHLTRSALKSAGCFAGVAPEESFSIHPHAKGFLEDPDAVQTEAAGGYHDGKTAMLTEEIKIPSA